MLVFIFIILSNNSYRLYRFVINKINRILFIYKIGIFSDHIGCVVIKGLLIKHNIPTFRLAFCDSYFYADNFFIFSKFAVSPWTIK